MITYPDRLVTPTPPPVVSEASKRLWAQLAAHLERCERPIAECGPCSDAYGLER